MEEEIRQIQTMLRELSFYDDSIERIIPDGIYGEQTAEAVRSFQRSNNLYVTGEVDNDTWDKIVEAYEKNYQDNKRQVSVVIIDELDVPIEVGSATPSLYVIQAMILALSDYFDNIDAIEITGVFDAPTQKEVEKIQIISGITPNSLIDRAFLNSLAELYNTHITVNRAEDRRVNS